VAPSTIERLYAVISDLDGQVGRLDEPVDLGVLLHKAEKAYKDLAAVIDRVKVRANLAMLGRNMIRVEVPGAGVLKVSVADRKATTDWTALASAIAAQVADEVMWDKDTGERRDVVPPPGVITQAAVDALLEIIPSSASVNPKVSGLDGRGLTRERYSEQFGGRATVRWE
jgi:hypothetical protein